MDLAIGGTGIVELDNPLNKYVTFSHVIDPYVQFTIDVVYMSVKLPYELPSLRRILLSTDRSIKVPDDSVGELALRSTWARLGLLSSRTTADPGFNGYLTIEIFNSSLYSILLRPGDKMLMLYFISGRCGLPIYNGRYQNQKGVTIAKALKQD